MQEFISEDSLKTFDGWMKYQAVDPAMLTPEQLATWRQAFEDVQRRRAARPKVGLMKLQPVPGEYRYAVAVEDGADLWLTLWVRRSRKGSDGILRGSQGHSRSVGAAPLAASRSISWSQAMSRLRSPLVPGSPWAPGRAPLPALPGALKRG